MNNISVSQPKTNPEKAISKAYHVYKELFKKLISSIENHLDKKAVKETNLREGKDFEKVASKLNI